MNYRLTRHAQEEMQRREISLPFVELVLNHPQQIIPEREGRKIYQSQVDFGDGKIFLLRIIVVDDVDPVVVITIYRTSRIAKYWRQP
jgi:hypothetical protein